MSTQNDAQLVQQLEQFRQEFMDEIGNVIIGQQNILDHFLIALICKGHTLLVGVPGLAKTLLIKSMAELLDLKFSRIQFTPDLMPSDITGTEVIEEDHATGKREFRFFQGPVFGNIILADEINRTPPKTQSALLQAMQEHNVTAGGQTYTLDEPFFVLATQNPIEQEGTYPLPEAQLDRFMFNIKIDYPSRDEEVSIVQTTTSGSETALKPIIPKDQLLAYQELVRRVPVAENVVEYAVDLLDNMALRARLVVEGYIIGQHKSPYHGFSVEFAEHRAYGPGDEIRHVDWKLYGKTDRYYVKQYEEETNLKVYILLDISRSMKYTSKTVSKLDYASYLSAALSYLMLNQRDGTGLILFDEKIQTFIPPRSTSSHLNTILKHLEKPKLGSDTEIGSVLHEMAERIKKRGLIILISDLMDDQESVLSGLKHFRHNKQEVILFHILDRKEMDFDFNARTRFKDMESGSLLTTEPWQIKSSYKKRIQLLQDEYKKQCRKQLIDYVPLFTDQSLDIALNSYLNKRQKLG